MKRIKRNTGLGGKQALHHLADCVFNTPLMIHPNKLRVILEEVGGRLIDPLSATNAISVLPLDPALASDPMNAAGGVSMREAGSQRRTYDMTESGIAILPIDGMLMKKARGMMAYSGMCTYEAIAEQFSECVEDAACRAILLDIDSPGGQTHGAFELSDLIYSARGSGKPIWACADDLAASAAYCLGSAAEKIYVTRTGAVGSIGVYALHADQEGLDSKMGLRYTYISAGEYKTDGNPHEALSKTAKATIKNEIDRQYAMFVDTVARNRGLSAESVIGAKALCYFADNAIPLLADEVGTLEDAVAALEAKLDKKSISTRSSSVTVLRAEAPVRPPIQAQANKEPQTMPAPTTATAPTPEDLLAAARAEVARLEGLAAVATATTTAPAVAAADTMPNDPDCPGPDDDDENEPMTGSTSSVAVPLTTSTILISTPKVTQTMPSENPLAAVAQKPKGRSPAAQIAELCTIAGQPSLAAGFMLQLEAGEITVADVRQHFLTERATASANNPTSSATLPGNNVGEPLDRFTQMANTIYQNGGGKISKLKAYEQAMQSNPELYKAYNDEREEAALTPSRIEKYVTASRPKLAAMGLGTGY